MTALTPVGGPSQGGTSVVITGSNLAAFGSLDGTLCRFGELVVRASSRSNSSIVCTSPNSCSPLSTDETDCAGGDRHLASAWRTSTVVDGQRVDLRPVGVSEQTQGGWQQAEVLVSLNSQVVGPVVVAPVV